ncbi:MAG TPA: amidohydrolase family protein [Oculatellaceae cyanobacterium]
MSKRTGFLAAVGVVGLQLAAIVPDAAAHLTDSQSATSTSAADMVFVGAPIYTVDACRRWAEAMAVKNGKIVYVGDEKHAKEFRGEKTAFVQLHGGMILPGFHDCHVHPLESGIEQQRLTLEDCQSVEALWNKVKVFADKSPKEPWVIASGWQLPLFPNANPLNDRLDGIIADRPALLVSQDAHSALANSCALRKAGITKDTPDPPHGKIERNANGEPTGTLRESAIDLVQRHVPKSDAALRRTGLLFALKKANGFGITSMQDAHANEDFLQTYRQLEDEGLLTSRMVTALGVDPDKDPHQVDDFVRLRNKYMSALVRPISAKIFADGVVESHTAALLEPYSDDSANYGLLNFSPDKLKEVVRLLDKNGFQVHVHAIGDRAVHETLNAFEDARKINGVNDNRHQIAHLELIQKSDLPRFRELGVVANFQAYWAFNDPYIVKSTVPAVGAERAAHLYPIKSVLETGAVLAGGSDWSVSSMNPLDAIQVGITRQGVEEGDEKQEPLTPSERVSLADMIVIYTINGAYDNHEESTNGSIEVGKAADFIVLDHNLFELPPSEIHKTHVTETYLNGRKVFQRVP